MIKTYLDVARVIQAAVPAILWFDLDKGQLDDPEAFNSLLIPSVLIGQSDISWKQLAAGYQQGEGTITVKTIFRLPVQTHLLDPMISGTIDAMFDLAEDVDGSVKETPGVLSRVGSKDYPHGTYYVIEQSYTASFKSGPRYFKKKVTAIVNPFLSRPTATA